MKLFYGNLNFNSFPIRCDKNGCLSFPNAPDNTFTVYCSDFLVLRLICYFCFWHCSGFDRRFFITEAEIKAPAVIHAKYGAYLAENKYGIQDPEIISAIACHTTGKPDMSTLDKILYIADYIEPRRDKADNLPQMRYLAFQDLDETMYEILKGTLEYLDKKGNTIDPITLQAYEYFAEAMKQKKANMHI